MAESAAQGQYTSHIDSGNVQPEQINASSADQPSELVLNAFYRHRSVRKLWRTKRFIKSAAYWHWQCA